MGLSDISFHVLGQKISKEEQLDNWSVDIISQKQRGYTAIDAWAALDI